MIVKYGNKVIEFAHIVDPKLKRAYISVDNKNGVVVKTPELSDEKMQELVRGKARWILQKKALVQENLSNFEFETGSRLPYLGKRYYLKLEEDKDAPVGRACLTFNHSKFTLRYNPYLMKKEFMYKALDRFYIEKAKERITALAIKWAEVMGRSYTKITFKKVAKRWGSCSSRGNIIFNYEAIKLPIDCVEYIVVHELAHLVHHDHSKDFWKLVEKYLPNYKEQHDKMRGFGL